MKILLLLYIFMILISCGFEESNYETSYMKLKAYSMSQCLLSIKSNTKSAKLVIYKDTPNKVTGNIANGELFWCDKKETGTSGIYFEGTYVVKKYKKK